MHSNTIISPDAIGEKYEVDWKHGGGEHSLAYYGGQEHDRGMLWRNTLIHKKVDFELGLKKTDKDRVIHMIFADTVSHLLHIYLQHSGISLDVRIFLWYLAQFVGT